MDEVAWILRTHKSVFRPIAYKDLNKISSLSWQAVLHGPRLTTRNTTDLYSDKIPSSPTNPRTQGPPPDACRSLIQCIHIYRPPFPSENWRRACCDQNSTFIRIITVQRVPSAPSLELTRPWREADHSLHLVLWLKTSEAISHMASLGWCLIKNGDYLLHDTMWASCSHAVLFRNIAER